MFGIAGRIERLLHIHRSAAVSLGIQTLHVSFSLLSIDVGDIGFARLEVVTDAVRLVFISALAEDRLARNVPQRVGSTDGMHQTAVDRNVYNVCFELEILVFDLTCAREMSSRIEVIERNGVFCRIVYGHVKGILALGSRIDRHGVLLQSIRQDGIGTQGDTIPQQRIGVALQEGNPS